MPASSHAAPLPSSSAFNDPFFLYNFKRSIISYSFLLDFFNFVTLLTTELSKKYKPVTAKLELIFLGFSSSLIIFLFLIVATPNCFGLFTGCTSIVAPFFNFVIYLSFSDRLCP